MSKEKATLKYSTKDKQVPTYFTVGQMRKLLENVGDECPILAAPLNDNIRVALDITIADDAQLCDYKGKIVIFTTGLFDIGSGKEINLVPEKT